METPLRLERLVELRITPKEDNNPCMAYLPTSISFTYKKRSLTCGLFYTKNIDDMGFAQINHLNQTSMTLGSSDLQMGGEAGGVFGR